MLLGDAELRELGFLMGPRKELLHWSSQQSQGVSSSSSSMSTSSSSLNGATSVQPVTTSPVNLRLGSLRLINEFMNYENVVNVHLVISWSLINNCDNQCGTE